MGFDHKGRPLALAGARAFPPFYLSGGGIAQRKPFDIYGRLVIIPITTITFFSFNDGAETGELQIDAAHGHVLTCSSDGGREIVFTNSDSPGSEWDSIHPPDSSLDQIIVAPGLFAKPDSIEVDIAAKNIIYQVF